MERAKFDDLNSQREFFESVKRKLGMGAVKLSKILKIESRNTLENYMSSRRAPPLEIINKLEELSGIKARDYIRVDGKVYRKRRGFMPCDPEVAEKVLLKKFKKDYPFLIKLIKSDLTIEQILNEMRKRGNRFDTSVASRCVGSYRTNLLSRIVENITTKEKEIVVSGCIISGNHNLAITFNLLPLHKIISKKNIRVGVEISKDRRKIRVFPLIFGRNLTQNLGGSIRILMTEKAGFKKGSKVDILMNPEEFGFDILDSIGDSDARILARELIKSRIKINSRRSTPYNHQADLFINMNNKDVLIEITRTSRYKEGYFKVGQGYIQKMFFPNATQVLVCKKQILSKDSLAAFKRIGIIVICSEFKEGWERAVLKELKKI